MKKNEHYTDWSTVPLVLSTPEAARLMRVHINSVKNMIADGRLPATKLGRVWKVNKADVMALLGVTPAAVDPDAGSWGEYQHIKKTTFGGER